MSDLSDGSPWAWRRLPVPLPEYYVRGLLAVSDVARHPYRETYIHGEWLNGGAWYFYLYAMLVKIPLGTWLLVVLAIVLSFVDPRARIGWFNECCLLIPFFSFLVFVSWASSVQFFRYVLPALPFLYMWASKVGRCVAWPVREGAAGYGLRGGGLARPDRAAGDAGETGGAAGYGLRATGFVGEGRAGLAAEATVDATPPDPPLRRGGDAGLQPVACSPQPVACRPQPALPYWWQWVVNVLVFVGVGWTVVSSLSVYPHSLSYFNELAGGSANGHNHLLDDSSDWGQDLFFFKDWLDQHPEVTPLHLAYRGGISPRLIGIEFEPVPGHDPRPGWHVLGVTCLRGGCSDSTRRDEFLYFLKLEPVARIGYSMHVYHLTLEDANRLRAEMGLPLLPDDGEGSGGAGGSPP